ncbi:MAG: asparagine synthase (glutamine-hydrolysing), partial [Halothiobacillaceae bacterium]
NPGTVWSPRYSDEMELLRSKKATVLLTGSGGDEMTWGHSLTYSRRLLRGDLTSLMEAITGCRQLQLPLLPALYRLFIQPVIPTSAQHALRRLRGRAETTRLPPWIPAATAKRFDLEAYLAAEPTPTFNNSALQARYEALRHSSTYNSVRSYQQVGAAHGIEVRHPFFDRRLMEFSFAIPDDLWLRHNYPKWLLRRTMTPHLPATVCWNRNKVIFDSFFAKVIRDQIDGVRVILADKRLEERGLLDTKQVLATLDTIKNSPHPSLTVDFLYVLMAQIWFQKYADG